jgi:hypothetical protein
MFKGINIHLKQNCAAVQRKEYEPSSFKGRGTVMYINYADFVSELSEKE